MRFYPFFNPFEVVDAMVKHTEDCIDAFLEPIIQSYWDWEWKRLVAQNGWQL